MGDVTLQLLLESKNLWPSQKQEIEYVVITIGDVFEKALEIVQQLRKKTSCVIDVNRRNLKNQFDYANSIGAKKAIIIGEQELKSGEVKIKDLETGEETTKKISQL